MKPTVIDPKTTTRAAAFDLRMNAPNPMVQAYIFLVTCSRHFFELFFSAPKIKKALTPAICKD